MPDLKDYLQLHFIVLIWGFTAILGLLIHIPAYELVFYRTLIAALLLAMVLKYRKRSFQLKRNDFLKIIGTGFLIAAHWILFFGSAKISTASVCLAGMTTGSLWTSLIEPMVYKRKPRLYEMILACIIIAGLYIIFRFEFNHFMGLVMALVSAFLAALFSVINSKLIRRHDHYVITFYEISGACLGIVLFSPVYVLIFAEGHSLQLTPGWIDLLWIFILAGLCTVYAYTTGVKLMKKFSAFAINLTVNLEPVYGIVLAFLIFGEREKMTPGFYLGTFIILLAVLTYPYVKSYFAEAKRKKVIQAIEARKLAKTLF